MSGPELTPQELRRVILNLDQVASSVVMPAGLHRLDAEVAAGFFADELRATLRGYVLSEHLAADTETATRSVPASWWDHAKHDAGSWAAAHRRAGRPVRWVLGRLKPMQARTLTLSVTWHRAATRPHSTLQMPDSMGSVVYQERTERHVDWSTPTTKEHPDA